MSGGTIVFSILGIAILVGAFLFLAFEYAAFSDVNQRVRDFVMAHRRTWLDPLMLASHVINGPVMMSLFSVAAALVLGFRWNAWKAAMVMTAIMIVETLLAHTVKWLHKAQRPPQIVANFFMKTYSFPSGHSTASMTFALVVPYFYAPFLSTGQLAFLVAFLVLNALVTAYGRLYLDKHWLVDILGGWCAAGITMLTGMLIWRLV